MPIIQSAVKRVKQAQKRNARNTQFKRKLKNNTRALEAAIESRKTKEAGQLLGKVYSSYDTAVKKNLIHKNAAARKKAHYSSLIKQLSVTKTKKKTTKKTTAKK